MKDHLKIKIDNILAENKDLPLDNKANRDLLCQLILAAVQGKIDKPTATVLTPEASAYDPKKDGLKGPRPQSL